MKTYVNDPILRDLFKRDPSIVSLYSKLVSDKKKYRYDEIDSNVLQSRPKELDSNVKNSQHILSLFPDIELAIQILITLAINALDVKTTQYVFSSSMVTLPPDIVSTLNGIVSDEIQGNYTYCDELDEILEECLMHTGSVSYAVIAENVVDEIINKRIKLVDRVKEQMYENDGTLIHKNILGDKSSVNNGLESYGRHTNTYRAHNYTDENTRWSSEKLTGIEITDNTDILKVPEVLRVATESRIHEKTRVDISDFYKPIRGDSERLTSVKPMRFGEREAIGRPLVFNPTAESVLPVYVPGKPQKHIGYYIALNPDGYSVSMKDIDTDNNKDNIHERFKKSTVGDEIRDEASAKLDDRKLSDSDAIKFFTRTVERTLLDRVSGGYNRSVSLADNQDFYHVMLARTLAKRNTKILFIPAELFTYIAIDYDKNGMGVNKLEGMCTLASLRSTLLFSKVMAQVKNNIRSTNVEVTLDPDDPHPDKTIEILQSEALKARQLDLPIGLLAPASLADWLHRSAVSFSYKNHPGLPQIELAYTDNTLESPNAQNNDVLDDLKSSMLNKVGVTADLIDNGLDANFATTAEANRLLLMKRAVKLRIKIMKHITHLTQSVCNNDRTIIDALLAALDTVDNFKEVYGGDSTDAKTIDAVFEYISTISVTVVSNDDSVGVDVLKERYDVYSDAISVAISSWISEYTIDESDLEVNDIDSLREMLQSYFLRVWQQNNGYLPELAKLVSQDHAGAPLVDLSGVMSKHTEGILKTINDYMEKIKGTEGNSDDDDTEGSGDDNSNDGGFGGGDDNSNDGGFGGGDDNSNDGGDKEDGSDDGGDKEEDSGSDDDKKDDSGGGEDGGEPAAPGEGGTGDDDFSLDL